VHPERTEKFLVRVGRGDGVTASDSTNAESKGRRDGKNASIDVDAGAQFTDFLAAARVRTETGCSQFPVPLGWDSWSVDAVTV